MLQETKRDLVMYARKLVKPYEQYSIDELADAYCEAVDKGDEVLKNIYVSALLLRFWYTIDKMFKANKVAPQLEYEDFYEWLYEAIEYACKYRGWQDPTKNLNAQQCINKCIDTIKLQKYYNLRLDKHKAANNCISLSTPVGDEDDRTIEDTLKSNFSMDDITADDNVICLIQNYINNNKVIEAILLDTIACHDVQKHFKRTIKTTNAIGEPYKYVEHSSEFWPFQLVKTLNGLSMEYKATFARRYHISDSKLTTCLKALQDMNNQRIYRLIDRTLGELRATYLN